MYTSIFIRLIPSTNEMVNYVRCNVRTLVSFVNLHCGTRIILQLQILLNTLAYCLAYGTVLAKMGRVHHIFHNPTYGSKVNLYKLSL